MAKMKSARHMIDELLVDFINTINDHLDEGKEEEEGTTWSEWTDRQIEVITSWATSDHVQWMTDNLQYVMPATSFLLFVCWTASHQFKVWRRRRAIHTTENARTSQTSEKELNTDRSQETESLDWKRSAKDAVSSKADTSKPTPRRPINPSEGSGTQEARATQKTRHLPSRVPPPLPSTKLTTPAKAQEDVSLKPSHKRMNKQRCPMPSDKLVRQVSVQVSGCDTYVKKTPTTTTSVKQEGNKENLGPEKAGRSVNATPVVKAWVSNMPAQYKRSDPKPQPSNDGTAMAKKNLQMPNAAELCTDKANTDKAISHVKDPCVKRPASELAIAEAQDKDREDVFIDKFHDITYLAANKNMEEKSKILQTLVPRSEDNKRARLDLTHEPLVGAGDSHRLVKEWTPRRKAAEKKREQSRVRSERKQTFKGERTEGRWDHSGDIITEDVTPQQWLSRGSSVLCIKCQIPSDTPLDTSCTGGVSSCWGYIDGRYVAVPLMPHSALCGYAWGYAGALCSPISSEESCECPNCLVSACSGMAKSRNRTDYTSDCEIPFTCGCDLSRKRSPADTNPWRGNSWAKLAGKHTESQTDRRRLSVHEHHSQLCKTRNTGKSKRPGNQETKSGSANPKKQNESQFLVVDGQRAFKRSKREHRGASRTTGCPVLANRRMVCDLKNSVISCHSIECLARENQRQCRGEQCQALTKGSKGLSKCVVNGGKPSLEQTGDNQLIKIGRMADSCGAPKASFKTKCLPVSHVAKASDQAIHHPNPLPIDCTSSLSHQDTTHLKAVKTDTLKPVKMRQEQDSRQLQPGMSRDAHGKLFRPPEGRGQLSLSPRHPEVKGDKCTCAGCRLTLPGQKDPAVEEGLSHISSSSMCTSSFFFSGFSSELSALCKELFKCPHPRSDRRPPAENDTVVQGDGILPYRNTLPESVKDSLPDKHYEDIKSSGPENHGEDVKPSLPVGDDRVMKLSFQVKPTGIREQQPSPKYSQDIEQSLPTKTTEHFKDPSTKDHSESVQQTVTTRQRDVPLGMSTSRDHTRPQGTDRISETRRWNCLTKHILTNTASTGSHRDDVLETPTYAMRTLQWLEETTKTASGGQELAQGNRSSQMGSAPFQRGQEIRNDCKDLDLIHTSSLLMRSVEPKRPLVPEFWHKRKGESVERDIKSTVLVEYRKQGALTKAADTQIQTSPVADSVPTPTPTALKLRDYLMESSREVHYFYRHSSDQTSPTRAIRPKLNTPKFQPYTSRAEAKRSKRDTERENPGELLPPRGLKSLLKADLSVPGGSPLDRPRVTARRTSSGIQSSFLFDNSREEKIIIFSESSFQLAEAEDISNTPDPQELVIGQDSESEKGCQVSQGSSLSTSEQDAAVKQMTSVISSKGTSPLSNTQQQIVEPSDLVPDIAKQIRIRKLSRYCQNSCPSTGQLHARPEINWSTETVCSSIVSSVNVNEATTLPYCTDRSDPKLKLEGGAIDHFPISRLDKEENHDRLTASLRSSGENVKEGLVKFSNLVPNECVRRDISDRKTQFSRDQNFTNKSACTDKARGPIRRSRIPRHVKIRRSVNSLKRRPSVSIHRGPKARTISTIKEIEPYFGTTAEGEQDPQMEGPTVAKGKSKETAIKEKMTQTSLSERLKKATQMDPEKGGQTQHVPTEPQPVGEPHQTRAGEVHQTGVSSPQYGSASPHVLTQQLYQGLNDVLLQVLGQTGQPNIIIIAPDTSKPEQEKTREALDVQLSPTKQRVSPISSDHSLRHRYGSDTSFVDLYSTSVNRTRMSTDTDTYSPASLRPATNERLKSTHWPRTTRTISREQSEVGEKKPSRIPRPVSRSLDRGEIHPSVRAREENRYAKGKISSFSPRVVTDDSPPPSTPLSGRSKFDQRRTAGKIERRIRPRSPEDWKDYYTHSPRKGSVDTIRTQAPKSFTSNARKKDRDINQAVFISKAAPFPLKSPAHLSSTKVRSKSSFNTPKNTQESISSVHSKNVMPSSKTTVYTNKLTQRSRSPSYLGNVRLRSRLPIRSSNVMPMSKKVKTISPPHAPPGVQEPPTKRVMSQGTEGNIKAGDIIPKQETIKFSSPRKKLNGSNNMNKTEGARTVARTIGTPGSQTRPDKVSQNKSMPTESHKSDHHLNVPNSESQQWKQPLNLNQSLKSTKICDHCQQRTASVGHAQSPAGESLCSESPSDRVRSLSHSTSPSQEIKAAVCRQVTPPSLKAKRSCSDESIRQESANVPGGPQSQDNEENTFHRPAQTSMPKPTGFDIALQTRKRDRKSGGSRRKQDSGLSVEGISTDPEQPQITKDNISSSQTGRPLQNKQKVTAVNVHTYDNKTENIKVRETALDLTPAEGRGVPKGRVYDNKQAKRQREPSLDPIARAAMRQAAAAAGRAAMHTRAPAGLDPNSPSSSVIAVKYSSRHVKSAEKPVSTEENLPVMEDRTLKTRKVIHGKGTNKTPTVNKSPKVDSSSPRKHCVDPIGKLYQKQTIASLQKMKRNSSQGRWPKKLNTETKASARNSQRHPEKQEGWQGDTTYVKESAVKGKLIRKAKVSAGISQTVGIHVDKSKHNVVYLTKYKNRTNQSPGNNRAESEQARGTALGISKLRETRVGKRKLVRKITETSQANQPLQADQEGHVKHMQEKPSSPGKEPREIKVTRNSIKQHPQPGKSPSIVSIGHSIHPQGESRKRELMNCDGISSFDADRDQLPDHLPGKIKDNQDESISSDLFSLFPVKAPPGWVKSKIERSPDVKGSTFSFNHFSVLEEDHNSLASNSKTAYTNKSRTVINLHCSDDQGSQGNAHHLVPPPHWERHGKLAGTSDDQTDEATPEKAKRRTNARGLKFTSVLKNAERDRLVAQIQQNRDIPVDLYQSSLRPRGDKFNSPGMDTTFSEQDNFNKMSVTRSSSGVQGLAWSSPTGSNANAKRSKSSPAAIFPGTLKNDDAAVEEGHQSWNLMSVEIPHVRGQRQGGEAHSRNTFSDQIAAACPGESRERFSLVMPVEVYARVEGEGVRNSRSDVRSDQSERTEQYVGKQRRDIIPHLHAQPGFSGQGIRVSPGKSTSPSHSGSHPHLFPATISPHTDSYPLPVKSTSSDSVAHPEPGRYAHEKLNQSKEPRQKYQSDELNHSHRLSLKSGVSEREADSQAVFRFTKDKSRYGPGSSETGNTWLEFSRRFGMEASSAFTYTEGTQRAATHEEDSLPLSTMWGYQDEAASLFMRGTCSDPARRGSVRPRAHPSKGPFSSIAP